MLENREVAENCTTNNMIDSRGDDLKYYTAHNMPYPVDTEQSAAESYWVTYPNQKFDAAEGKKLYESYARQVVHADQSGFDGIMLLEHQATPNCMTPVAMVMAALLMPRIERARLAVCCNPAGLDHPLRLAEGLAMLDVMSGGRLEVTFTLGAPQDYWACGVRPATARARFDEATNLILQAWSEPGPSSFVGQHYSHRWLNLWPRPMQRSLPVTVLDLGSPQSSTIAARRGWSFCPGQATINEQNSAFQRYDAELDTDVVQFGGGDRMLSVLAYVAETDELAMAEAQSHLRVHREVNCKIATQFAAAPGYLSVDEYRQALQSGNHQVQEGDKDGIEPYRIVIGSAATVARKIQSWSDSARCSRILFHPQFGDMPEWKVCKNMSLFAQQVIPLVRDCRREDMPVADQRSQ